MGRGGFESLGRKTDGSAAPEGGQDGDAELAHDASASLSLSGRFDAAADAVASTSLDASCSDLAAMAKAVDADNDAPATAVDFATTVGCSGAPTAGDAPSVADFATTVDCCSTALAADDAPSVISDCGSASPDDEVLAAIPSAALAAEGGRLDRTVGAGRENGGRDAVRAERGVPLAGLGTRGDRGDGIFGGSGSLLGVAPPPSGDRGDAIRGGPEEGRSAAAGGGLLDGNAGSEEGGVDGEPATGDVATSVAVGGRSSSPDEDSVPVSRASCGSPTADPDSGELEASPDSAADASSATSNSGFAAPGAGDAPEANGSRPSANSGRPGALETDACASRGAPGSRGSTRAVGRGGVTPVDDAGGMDDEAAPTGPIPSTVF